MEFRDYYAVLGIDKKASADEIKQAYRRLARKYHPDVSKEANAEDKFKDVQEAYEVLKDTEKRAAYDQLGSNWKAGQEFRPPPGGGSGHFYYSGNGGDYADMDAGEFSDFFSSIFGGGGARGRGHFDRGQARGFQQRGSDQRAAIKVSLEEAFRGTTKTIQLQMPEMDIEGNIKQTSKTLKVTIPAGAVQGQQLRLAQQGGPGIGGAPAGDLYLEIDIEPHPLFSLQGKDVFLTLPVTPWEAALGGEIKVPTLGGQVGLKLSPDSQAGQKLRLKGRGLPGKPDAGDQYAILKIEVPPPKTDEQRQLYQKMAETMPFNPRKDWPV
jgi:curved DNA-binding protein